MNKLIKYLLVVIVFQGNVALANSVADEPIDKSNWRSMLSIARNAYQTKDFKKAILFYETLLPVLPKTIDISEEIAQTRYRLKEFDSAAELYQKKSATDKNARARSLHNLGNIAMENKDYSKAIEHYKNALRDNTSNEKTRYNLSEAIRRKNEENKKNPPPKDDNKNDDPKDKPKEKPQENEGDNKNESPSALNDQSVQRELEKLMKKEAETKRKVSSGKGEKGGVKSQKDW